jgi:hypothetical protein
MTTESIIDCFSCGRSMVDRGPRFCSVRCRDWFDAGNPPYEPLDTGRLYGATWRHVAGPHPGYLPKPLRMAGKLTEAGRGFYLDCAGCGKEFESGSLCCCSTACERAYVARQKNLADMLDAPAAKRRCEQCGGDIPRWRNGRKVSKSARFCGPRCQQKTARLRGGASSAVLTAETQKKPLFHGAS